MAPYYPVASGAYQGKLFNKIFVHFGGVTLLSHLIHSAGWAYANFFNAIPTAFVVISVVNIYHIRRKRLYNGMISEALFAGALLAPLLYGLLQIPVGNRYLNIFLLILLLRILHDFVEEIDLKSRRWLITVFLLMAGIIVEILPFRPFFGSFRPVWSNYSSSYNRRPNKAVINPWWMGWGEEVFLSGKKIRRYLKENGSDTGQVTIYHNYLGEWMFKPGNYILALLDTVSEISYDDNDFFVLNRMGVAQSADEFPESVRVFDNIESRGFVYGWIFRGSDLKKSGFRFVNGKKE
jgi:hypothetical protein